MSSTCRSGERKAGRPPFRRPERLPDEDRPALKAPSASGQRSSCRLTPRRRVTAKTARGVDCQTAALNPGWSSPVSASCPRSRLTRPPSGRRPGPAGQARWRKAGGRVDRRVSPSAMRFGTRGRLPASGPLDLVLHGMTLDVVRPLSAPEATGGAADGKPGGDITVNLQDAPVTVDRLEVPLEGSG